MQKARSRWLLVMCVAVAAVFLLLSLELPRLRSAQMAARNPSPDGVGVQPAVAPVSRVPPGKIAPPKFTVSASESPSAIERLRTERVDLRRVFNDEVRNPRWAPAMESALKQRFAAIDYRSHHLDGMTLSEVECRQSSCRIQFEYPAELPEQLSNLLREKGIVGQFSPIEWLELSSGPTASAGRIVSDELVQVDGKARHRYTFVGAFAPDSIDPSSYSDWTDRMRPRMQKLRARLELQSLYKGQQR